MPLSCDAGEGAGVRAVFHTYSERKPNLSDLYHSLTIDTPENVELDAEIAGFATRCVAAFIDNFILAFIMYIVGYIYLRAFSNTFTSRNWAIGALVGGMFLIMILYHLIFELMWNGQSPGKRMVGVRVVQADGLPVTSSAIIIRNLLRLFDFLPVFYGIGLVSIFGTRHTQRLGDLAARTIIIRERQQIKLNTVQENMAVTYHMITRIEPLPAHISIANLQDEDRREIVAYLQRRKTLRRREYIVGPIATRIARKMGNEAIIPDFRSPVVAERFLEQMARAFELAAGTPTPSSEPPQSIGSRLGNL
jgi:uncharacterized RDD family membrane protein YckC